jgi:4-amino-4-deoxy-L-arabinose transferase-like glycosyltransferase
VSSSADLAAVGDVPVSVVDRGGPDVVAGPLEPASVIVADHEAGDEGATRVGRWCVLAVTVVSLGLNTWRLSLNGLGDQYYAAATRAMATSWHNWFFVALDKGGFITVDKPPVPLWISALSARTFGVGTWSVLLPSALAGTAAVALLWIVVRRRFGVVAATVAALVLAVSPVNVAVDRLNLPEAWLILFLLAAVWAVQHALSSTHSIRWLVLAGSFVGVAFNTKMLAAYLVVPGVGLAVLLGSRTWRQALGRGAVFAMTTLVTSLPWILIVDLVPAGSRPYVGGSTDNTVLDLIFGYNGLGRVEGNGGFVPGGATSNAGGVFGGRPGPLRILGDALGGQIAWLLPLVLAGFVGAIWLHRRQRVQRALVVMWALWLAVVGYVFSLAQGTFHAYYTALLGPAVAALVGIGVASFVPLVRRERRWWYLVVAGVAGTVAMQLELSGRFPDFYGWTRALLVTIVVAAAGALAVLVLRRSPGRTVLVAAGALLGGLLVTPAAWAASETANPVLNATLPQAGPRRGLAGETFGATSSNGDASLAAWLLANAGGERWQLVMGSAQLSSGLMADQGLSIISLGGFMGTDPAASLRSIGRAIDAGQVRYVLVRGGGRARGRPVTDPTNPASILAEARTACIAVLDPTLPARYVGQIYDCAGAGGDLIAAVPV